jgi:hypothetical protein
MIYFLLILIATATATTTTTVTARATANKFCINCKYYQSSFLSSSVFGKCKVFPREMDNKIDYLITGKPKTEYIYCSTARNDEDKCSPTGKYYEKKINLFRKITCFKDKE